MANSYGNQVDLTVLNTNPQDADPKFLTVKMGMRFPQRQFMTRKENMGTPEPPPKEVDFIYGQPNIIEEYFSKHQRDYDFPGSGRILNDMNIELQVSKADVIGMMIPRDGQPLEPWQIDLVKKQWEEMKEFFDPHTDLDTLVEGKTMLPFNPASLEQVRLLRQQFTGARIKWRILDKFVTKELKTPLPQGEKYTITPGDNDWTLHPVTFEHEPTSV